MLKFYSAHDLYPGMRVQHARPMKPTYVLDARTATPHFPGIGRYVKNLLQAMPPLLAADEELAVLFDPQHSGQFAQKDARRSQIVHVYAASSPFALQQQWQIPQALRSLKPGNDALVYHSPYYLMPYFLSMPAVLTFYDLIPLFFPHYVSPRARLLFRFTMRMALRTAQQILSISQSAAQDLAQYFALDPQRITTTPLAPDPCFCPQPQAEIERVRQKYGLPAGFFLYFGINKPHKNLPALISAYAEWRTKAALPLVIAGAWDQRYPESKQLVAQKKLGEAVTFLGSIPDDDLPGLYAAATAFIFPSRYEGFGLPVLEAMACGTPVACSNTSSLPEVAGDAALLFAPDSPSALAHALSQLMDAPTRLQMRDRGLQQAARFTWQRTAQQTLAVYRNLVKNPAGP